MSGKSLVALVLSVGVLVMGACADEDNESRSAAVRNREPASREVVEQNIELGELFIRPGELTVPDGSDVVFHVRNVGAIQHDFKLKATGQGTALLNPGASEDYRVSAVSGALHFVCTVPGHEAAGMAMDVRVSEPLVGARNTTPATPSTKAPSTIAQTGAKIDPNATPAPGWSARDAALPRAAEGTLHQLTFDATEVTIEVAPGVTQELWTFNNLVPGPVLRGRVGDVFEITLVNKGKLGHSIDFHASKVAWNDEMRTIQPGESLVYRFEAKSAGVFMYHCGTPPALHHIGNGMYGAIIVDPPDLSSVDREYVFVQSELYLGPLGQPGDLAKMQSESFDAVVFNGYFNQYVHAPIHIEPNERVRAWVVNMGPSENSAFHIVGTVFDSAYKEGAYVLRPGDGRGGAQVLDLQPAQGGFVEFTMDEPGLYPIVTHKFANVGKGALGLFQAGPAGAAGGGH